MLGTGHEEESGEQYQKSGVRMRGFLSSKARAWRCLALIKLKEASVLSGAPRWTIWPWADLPRPALTLVCLVWCPRAVHLLAALYQLLPPLEAARASHGPRWEKNRDAWLSEGFVHPITLPSPCVWLLLRCCQEEVFSWPPWDTSRWPRWGENTGGWAMLLVLRQSHVDEDKGCTHAAVVLGRRWGRSLALSPWFWARPCSAAPSLVWACHWSIHPFVPGSALLWFCSYF